MNGTKRQKSMLGPAKMTGPKGSDVFAAFRIELTAITGLNIAAFSELP